MRDTVTVVCNIPRDVYRVLAAKAETLGTVLNPVHVHTLIERGVTESVRSQRERAAVEALRSPQIVSEPVVAPPDPEPEPTPLPEDVVRRRRRKVTPLTAEVEAEIRRLYAEGFSDSRMTRQMLSDHPDWHLSQPAVSGYRRDLGLERLYPQIGGTR